MGLFEAALSFLAVILTIVNGWLVFVLKGLQAQLDLLREVDEGMRASHDNLRDRQSSHETRMAERTLTREEFKHEMAQSRSDARNELASQTTQITQLMNAAIRNIPKA